MIAEKLLRCYVKWGPRSGPNDRPVPFGVQLPTTRPGRATVQTAREIQVETRRARKLLLPQKTTTLNPRVLEQQKRYLGHAPVKGASGQVPFCCCPVVGALRDGLGFDAPFSVSKPKNVGRCSMLFWLFFLGLVIAGVIFRFVYSVLILPFLLGDFSLRPLRLFAPSLADTTPIAKGPGSGNTEAGDLPKASWITLAIGFLFTVYMVCGWAAFVARCASSCSQAPSVEHHWLYYLFGFFLCTGAATTTAVAALLVVVSNGRDNRAGFVANLPSIIAPVAYGIFSIWPAFMLWPYGWALDRVVGSPPIAVSPADEAMKRGKAAANKEDWDLAITEYTKAIQLDPKRARAYAGRGVAYVWKREWDRAISDCSASIQLDARNPDAFCGLGNAYLQKGELDKAIANLSETIRLDPRFAEAYANRGLAYGQNGELEKAITDCSEAIRLDPTKAGPYCNRGNAYIFGDESEKAIVDLSEAIRLDPTKAEPYSSRGFVHWRKGRLDQAIKDCSEAIHLNPQLPGPYFVRGSAYRRKGENSKAKLDFEQAKRLGFKPQPELQPPGEPMTRDKAAIDATDRPLPSNPPQVAPAKGDSPPVVTELADLVERVEPSVVQLNVRNARGFGTGSGFVLDTQGTIVTNCHVIRHAVAGTVVFSDGTSAPIASCIGVWPRADIAFLRVECAADKLRPLRLATSPPRIGERVASFGSPLGFSRSVSEGIVSGIRSSRELNRFAPIPLEVTLIQTTAPISHGNSGGPLLNMEGAVVGVNTLSFQPIGGQNLNFAVSSVDVHSLREKTSPWAMGITTPVQGST